MPNRKTLFSHFHLVISTMMIRGISIFAKGMMFLKTATFIYKIFKQEQVMRCYRLLLSNYINVFVLLLFSN